MRNYPIVAALGVLAVTLAAAAVPGAAAATTGPVAGSAATLYVDNQISGTVTPISVATKTPGKAIKAGSGPTNMEITPNGKTVYVVDSGARVGTVTPISTATSTPGKPIKTGNTPWSIVCAPTVCRSSSTAG
jgi:DNA-binding beta-propeller fold protein YncE